ARAPPPARGGAPPVRRRRRDRAGAGGGHGRGRRGMSATHRSTRRVRLPFGGVNRRRWENETRNQAGDPVQEWTAATGDDLLATVDRARRDHLTVRCVGSGHSWSDVALTTGYLIRPDDLSDVALTDRDLLRSGLDNGHLVRVRSGTTIRELNAWL